MTTNTRLMAADRTLTALLETARERSTDPGHHHFRSPFIRQSNDPQAQECVERIETRPPYLPLGGRSSAYAAATSAIASQIYAEQFLGLSAHPAEGWSVTCLLDMGKVLHPARGSPGELCRTCISLKEGSRPLERPP
jgi:hypothetical protein